MDIKSFSTLRYNIHIKKMNLEDIYITLCNLYVSDIELNYISSSIEDNSILSINVSIELLDVEFLEVLSFL